jgi:uncharacterized protein YijF (DUF1287 family)
MSVSAPAVRFACLFLTLAGTAGAGSLDLVNAARQQVGVTLVYDGSYRALRYPGGDVPIERGVCTDVIVRALRVARSLDLQKLVHEDMRAHFQDYPSRRRWGLARPDANIDHRRVPNLMTWFERAGYARPVSAQAADYLPGDLVTWDLGGGIPHIGIVSDRRSVTGTPLVIHNIGAGAREEDILFRYAITGHYRPPPPSGVARR